MVLAFCGWSYTAYLDSLSELLWSCLECGSSPPLDELAPSERTHGIWLAWLEKLISRFYTTVPAVLGELCTESPLLSMGCEVCSVCQGSGWDSKIAEVRAAQRCCRWYICCLLVRAIVHCGAEGTGGERHPQTQ